VEMGFKEARPWPRNVKFQFWHSFNMLQQRKVVYATLEGCVHNFVPESSKKASGRKLRAQLGLDRIKICTLLQCCVRSFASNFTSNFLSFGSSS
ncbi:hypothetical protein PIB30_081611, partial [Stylosanthes scabra]|nr:hypothetical protein [Stylosanthes scabra]